jgi:hypothetical protein
VPPVLALLTVLCLFLMFRGLDSGQLLPPALNEFGRRSIRVTILAAMLFSFWIDFNWVYFLAAHGRRMLVNVLIMLVLLKGVPLGLDSLISYFGRELAGLDWTGYGYLSGLSPIGTLVLAPNGGAPVWVGLAFQAVLALGATMLGRRVRRRLARPVTAVPVSDNTAGVLPT